MTLEELEELVFEEELEEELELAGELDE